MAPLIVHLIHVGNMSNKGTQGLLKSDILVIRDVVKGDVIVSVSTSDVEGVKRLNLSLEAVLPPMVDIPYERADWHARRLGYAREGYRYKAVATASAVFLFIQTVFSIVSAVLIKSGLKAFYRAETLKRLKDCDVVISCSDENFKEGTSMLPLNGYWIIMWWTMLISRACGVLIAKFLGKPVVMFPNSVGPFRTWIGRFLSKLALNRCDYLLVREPVSYRIVDSLGIRSPKILASDTSLLLEPPHELHLDNVSDSVIGVSPGFYSHTFSEKEISAYIDAHAKALDMSIEKYGFSVLFLPHYVRGFHYDDLEVCELIMRQMKKKDRARIANVTTVEELRSLLNQMDMVISSKMHPAVFAAAAYVPTLCVAYDHKQTGFFEQLGIIDCVVPISELSSERLFQKIGDVWNRRESLRNLLKTRVQRLQKDLRKSIQQALAAVVKAKCAKAIA